MDKAYNLLSKHASKQASKQARHNCTHFSPVTDIDMCDAAEPAERHRKFFVGDFPIGSVLCLSAGFLRVGNEQCVGISTKEPGSLLTESFVLIPA